VRRRGTTVDAVQEQVHRVLADGLFIIDEERSLVVSETFDNGPELVETVAGWRGTRISQRLALAAGPRPRR
jgi:hypothetical protein